MEALLLSYLYLYVDSNPKATEFGAGDLATSIQQTGLSDRSVYFSSSHELLAKLYNGMVNGSLPGFALNLPNLFFCPSGKHVSLEDGEIFSINKTLNNIIPFKSKSVLNYHYLWYSYLNGTNTVSVFCFAPLDCTKYVKIVGKKRKITINYKLPTLNYHFLEVEKLRNNTNISIGALLEGELNEHPCLNSKIINTFKIKEICDMLKLMSENSNQFLKMMKYVIQSPVYVEEEDEYLSTFKHANLTLSERGFFFKQNKVKSSY